MYNNSEQKSRRNTTPVISRTLSIPAFKNKSAAGNNFFFATVNPSSMPFHDPNSPENIFINLFMDLALVSYKKIPLSEQQKSQITEVLSSVGLQDKNRMLDCVKEQILSHDLYLQILTHLLSIKKKNQVHIDSERLELDIKIARWFIRKEPSEFIEIEEKFDINELTKDLKKQKVLRLVWAVCTKDIDYQQIYDGSLLLVLKFGSEEIISCLDMLFSEMTISQLGVAQYLLFVITQHSTQESDELINEALISYEKKLNIVKESLVLHKAYFLPDIQLFFEQKKQVMSSRLEENYQLLNNLFQEIVLTRAPSSFVNLFTKGLEAKKNNRKEVIWLVVNEMLTASKFFFQNIPLEEYTTTNIKKRFQANNFILYFNKLSAYITQLILEQSAHQVVTALALILDIAKQLRSSKHLNFLDINSLMLIQSCLESSSISRLSNHLHMLSHEEIKFKDKLSSLLSLDKNSDAVRKIMDSSDKVIPWPGLFLQDVQHAVDGNSTDALTRLMVHGDILRQIYKLKQKLQHEPVLFATTILQDIEEFMPMSVKEQFTLSLIQQPKPSDHINLDDIKSIYSLLDKLRFYLDKNIIPSIVKGKKTYLPGKKAVKLLYKGLHTFLEKEEVDIVENYTEAQKLSKHIVKIADSYGIKVEPLFTEDELTQLTSTAAVFQP